MRGGRPQRRLAQTHPNATDLALLHARYRLAREVKEGLLALVPNDNDYLRDRS